MLHGEEPWDLTDHATHLGKALFDGRRRDALVLWGWGIGDGG
jgi:hypothetical protein